MSAGRAARLGGGERDGPWLIERLRNQYRDRAKALSVVEEAERGELREALAEYDAFVPGARALKDGILLGTARSSGGEEILLRVPFGCEHVHWLVQGGTGTGKTTWVASILRQALEADRPFGVVDCKGDLFDAVLRLTAAAAKTLPPAGAAKLRERLVVINPFGDDLVPLNVCRPFPGVSPEVQAYEVTIALSRLFDTALGLHMENILRHLLILLTETGLSLVEAPDVLQDDLIRGILANQSTNPAVKNFFLGAWPSVPQASKDALLGRLHSLLLPENLRLMLGADDLLDLRGILDEGRLLLVFLGKGSGVPEEQVQVLGSLVMQLLFQATYGRKQREQKYLLALDEFFHLLEAPALSHRFETALTTVRSFGLSLLLVHHNFAQLPQALREIILGNCDHIALFRTGGRTQAHFGDFLPDLNPELLAEFRMPPGRISRDELRRSHLESLQRLPNRTLWWYDRTKPYRAVRLDALSAEAPHEIARMSQREFENAIRSDHWDRGSAAVPRASLRAQIETRRKRLRDLVNPPVEVSSPQTTEDGGATPPPRKKRRPRIG